ncbi:MAG: hydroxyethylthiazole kinase [Vibrio sp.]
MHEQISNALNVLRQQNPLVVNITNYVVMNNTANALLALGASPIMSHSRAEMAEMMSFAGALVINMGTLDEVGIARMRYAITQANLNSKPVVLDPVGCGASQIRTQTAREFCQLADKLIVRANASEVMALADVQSQTKGVDALDSSDSAIQAAQKIIQQYQAQQVVISGENDYVVTADNIYKLSNGHAMMPKITGMGCSHSALTGAFAAIDFEHAGLCATAVLGIAGQIAAEKSRGPASLQVNLIDELYRLEPQAIERILKCEMYTDHLKTKLETTDAK